MLLPAALFLALQQPEAGPDEIHVDERCHVFTQDRPGSNQPYSKPGFHDGSALCHLTADHTSSHWDEDVAKGAVCRTKVHIHERSYLLFNPSDARVAFDVYVSLPDGWTIDSFPQPTEIVDHMATFRVYAKPGETLRLHIGERK